MKKVDGYFVFLHLVLVALVVQVVLLMGENKKLMARPKSPPTLARGEQMDPIPVRNLDGREATLAFNTSPEETILLVFTTTCPVCQENQAAWRELYERFNDHYNIVGLSVGEMEPTREYAAAHSLPFRVVIPAELEGFPSRYKIPAVPQTIRLSTRGTVEDEWTGQLPQEFIDRLTESGIGELSAVAE